MNKNNTTELIEFILFSIDLIEERFQNIHLADDFFNNNAGLEKLDAISMRLQSIGEAIKNISKHNNSILLKLADKDYWSTIIKCRDILSHHYVDIDSEIIFDICNEDLKELKSKILQLK